VNTPSSKSLISQNAKISSWRVILLSFATIALLTFLWNIGTFKNDPFITQTLSIQGEALSGSKLFKINCVGCHGISAQGFVGPDLHEVTQQMSDKKIINQVIRGLTPPMPSFEINPESMADLLAYMHSLN
tara:strand:- start:3888 stop:4277 length:390 start_codon:yes stop_codon:yes gene_type:complete